MSNNLLKDYCKKIDDLAPATFNEDQKILAKKILEKADEKDLQNIFQMLIQRIKIGFTFDVAPTCQKEDEESIALLKKDEQRSFKNYENTSNIENTLIIGENYDALKNLLVIERERERESSSHSDAYYDVIYIDPPYNTESAKDDGNHLADEKSDIAPSKFVYRDKFSRNGWLNMLNERLRLAKQLLKDDGVIFVSIDDNEQAYLKILMDEIFGEENFVSNIIWNSNNSVLKQSKYIRKDHEYIVCYAKNIKFLKFKKMKSNIKFSNIDNDPKGPWFSANAAAGGGKEFFEITLPNGNKISRKWIFTKSDYQSGRINLYFKGNNVPRLKVYESDYNANTKVSSSFLILNDSKISTDIGGTTTTAKFEVSKIIEIGKADTPKPTNLIVYILNLLSKKNIRVLDFYAGTGTTGHAVLKLNEMNNENNTYTLITNNENNIAYEKCYERLYRVNNGLGTNDETFEWTKKNKPYKQNLNVFSIDYYNTSILKKDDNDSIAKIKKALNKEIEEFGITPSSNFNVDIYYDLLSLKPILKGDK